MGLDIDKKLAISVDLGGGAKAPKTDAAHQAAITIKQSSPNVFDSANIDFSNTQNENVTQNQDISFTFEVLNALDDNKIDESELDTWNRFLDQADQELDGKSDIEEVTYIDIATGNTVVLSLVEDGWQTTYFDENGNDVTNKIDSAPKEINEVNEAAQVDETPDEGTNVEGEQA